MVNRTAPVVMACVLGAGLFAAAPLAAPQRGAKEGPRGTALTARDYLEIQQLVAQSSYALDSVADNGDAYARLFTADGALRTGAGGASEVKGRDKLAAFARSDVTNQGPLWVHHFVLNHIIQAAPQGATGRVYVVGIDIAEGTNPGAIRTGGHFEDVYAKTAEGWRIRMRTYVPSALGPRP
ncbi:MAG: nuclear transport factor 2 family protein [Acidobacteriota bacterium]